MKRDPRRRPECWTARLARVRAWWSVRPPWTVATPMPDLSAPSFQWGTYDELVDVVQVLSAQLEEAWRESDRHRTQAHQVRIDLIALLDHRTAQRVWGRIDPDQPGVLN